MELKVRKFIKMNRSFFSFILFIEFMLIVNIFLIHSSVLGVICFALYLFANGYIVGSIFFEEFSTILKVFHGIFIFTIMIGLVTIFLTLFYIMFPILVVLLVMLLSCTLLILTPNKFNYKFIRISPKQHQFNLKNYGLFIIFFVCLFLFLVVEIFPLRRVEIISNVRLSLSLRFYIGFFMLLFLLGININSLIKKKTHSSLTFFLSNLASSLLLWIPGLIILTVYNFGLGFPWGTDQSIHLAYIRNLINHEYDVWGSEPPFTIYRILRTFPEDWSRKLIVVLRYILFYSLIASVVQLTQVSVLTVFSLFIPFLIVFYLPLITYSIVISLEKYNTKFLYTFFLAPIFVLGHWTGVSVPNALGFILSSYFLFLVLYYMKHPCPRIRLLLIIMLISSMLTHYLTGFINIVLTLLAIAYNIYISSEQKILQKILSLFILLFAILIFPTALLIYNIIYYKMPFSVIRKYDFSSTTLLKLLFGELSSLKSSELILMQIIVIFIGGVLLSVLLLSLKLYPKHGCLISFYAIFLWIDYLILYNFRQFSVVIIPFGPSRLFIPLMHISFINTTIIFSRINIYIHNWKEHLEGYSSKVTFSFAKYRTQIIAYLLILLISLFGTINLFYTLQQGYTHKFFPYVSVYDKEAILLIDKMARNHSYVTICDRQFAEIGMSLMGYATSKGVYTAYWDELREIYREMIKNPSLDIIIKAINYTHTDIAFFVINKLRERDYYKVLQKAIRILTPILIDFRGIISVFMWPDFQNSTYHKNDILLFNSTIFTPISFNKFNRDLILSWFVKNFCCHSDITFMVGAGCNKVLLSQQETHQGPSHEKIYGVRSLKTLSSCSPLYGNKEGNDIPEPPRIRKEDQAGRDTRHY